MARVRFRASWPSDERVSGSSAAGSPGPCSLRSGWARMGSCRRLPCACGGLVRACVVVHGHRGLYGSGPPARRALRGCARSSPCDHPLGGRGRSGVEQSREGDSLFITFPSATCGARGCGGRAAFGIEREPWPPDGRVRVRMGLHVGEVAETRAGLVGLAIHQAARIMSAAHGGQIVVSGDVVRQAGSLPATKSRRGRSAPTTCATSAGAALSGRASGASGASFLSCGRDGRWRTTFRCR